MRDTMAEMAAKAHEISLEAGSRMTSTIRDVINAAAGLAGFAVESARDLVQYMVRRGQMTQDEADKLMREAEEAYNKRKPEAREADAAPAEHNNGALRSRELKSPVPAAAPQPTAAAKRAVEPAAAAPGPRPSGAAKEPAAAAAKGAPAKAAAKESAAKAPAKAAATKAETKPPAVKGAAKVPAKSAAKAPAASKGGAKTASKSAAKKPPAKKK